MTGMRSAWRVRGITCATGIQLLGAPVAGSLHLLYARNPSPELIFAEILESNAPGELSVDDLLDMLQCLSPRLAATPEEDQRARVAALLDGSWSPETYDRQASLQGETSGRSEEGSAETTDDATVTSLMELCRGAASAEFIRHVLHQLNGDADAAADRLLGMGDALGQASLSWEAEAAAEEVGGAAGSWGLGCICA